MNETTPPPPRPEPPALDLDTRILRAEQRLVARDDALRAHVATAGARLRELLQPRRLAATLGGGLLAVGVVAWLGRRLGGFGLPRAPAPLREAAPAAVPWVGLLGLAWPVLPQRWRDRMSPATAGTLLAVALPLLRRLAGRQAQRQN